MTQQVATATNRSFSIQPGTTSSQKALSRWAGLLYLLIIIAGISAQFIVRGSLVIPGNPATTAANLAASESLFRLGIVGDLVMIMSDIALAVALYLLFRPVNRGLSLLAAFFRLAQATAIGLNLLNLFIGLQMITGAPYLAAQGSEQTQALALFFLELHGVGYTLSLTFFSLSLLVLSYLVIRSGALPKLIGWMLMFAALAYLGDSLAVILLTNYADFAEIIGIVVFVPALIAELGFCLWLLVKGVVISEKRD